jgi:hypothetical protein
MAECFECGEPLEDETADVCPGCDVLEDEYEDLFGDDEMCFDCGEYVLDCTCDLEEEEEE